MFWVGDARPQDKQYNFLVVSNHVCGFDSIIQEVSTALENLQFSFAARPDRGSMQKTLSELRDNFIIQWVSKIAKMI